MKEGKRPSASVFRAIRTATHVVANIANPAGVDVLGHVVALVGGVRLEPLWVDLALVEEGVAAVAQAQSTVESGRRA